MDMWGFKQKIEKYRVHRIVGTGSSRSGADG